MSDHSSDQRASDDESETGIDDAVEDTFSASDPPSDNGASRQATDETMANQNAGDSDVPGTDPDKDIPDEDTPAEPSPDDLPPDEDAPQGDAPE